MVPIFLFFLFLLGLFIGSFLNVLIDRLPRNESVIKGRSHCEHCKKTLAWYDLIPLFSFVQLRGKCRYCGTQLSYYYPIIELVTGVMFVAAFLFVNRNLPFTIYQLLFYFSLLYYLFVTSCLIVIFFTDLKYGIIPDKIVYPVVIVSLLFNILFSQSTITGHVLSAVGALIFFLFLFVVTKGRGMGFGDVKLSFLMGLFLGFPAIIVGLYTAFLTGAILGIILILCGKKKFFGGSIPFGPFLVLGTFIGLFWGDTLLSFFLSHLPV